MIWRCRFDTVDESNLQRQIQQSRTAETTSPDDQHARVLQTLLTIHPDIGNAQVTAIATDLVDGQLFSRFHQRWQRHVSSMLMFVRTQAAGSTLSAQPLRDTAA